MNSIRLAGLAVVLLLSVGVSADPPHEAPATPLERGIGLYERGQFDEAIVELQSAYRADPSAEVCYALGQALRKKSACGKAIPYFRCAVEKTQSESVARAARYQIGRCVLEEGDKAPATVQTADGAGVGDGPAHRDPVRGETRKWWRDAAGASLLSIGLGGAVAGAVLLGHAESLARASSDNLEAYRAAGAVGPERIAGIVALTVGSSLVVGGVIRYAVRARRVR